MLLPLGALDSYIQGQAPMASGGGCKQSFAGKLRSCPAVLSSLVSAQLSKSLTILLLTVQLLRLDTGSISLSSSSLGNLAVVDSAAEFVLRIVV